MVSRPSLLLQSLSPTTIYLSLRRPTLPPALCLLLCLCCHASTLVGSHFSLRDSWVPHHLCHPSLRVAPFFNSAPQSLLVSPATAKVPFPTPPDCLPNSWSPNSNSLGPVIHKLICTKEGPVGPASISESLEIFWQPRLGGRGKW